MTGIPPAVEICPYCSKPFKRLKSHLPHCKLARDASFTFDSREILSPNVKASNSVTPKFLNNVKKKGQTKSTDVASKKENKKSKSDWVRDKTTVKADSLERLDTARSSTASNSYALESGENTQKQVKHAAAKACRKEVSRQRAAEEVKAHAQPPVKVLSETKLAKKSPRAQKSRSKATSASGSISELPIQSGKSASTSPSQTVKPPAKQRQTKKAFTEQSMPGLMDSSMGDLQPIPQEVTKGVELVIENHRVKVLRNECEPSVPNIPLNEGAISNHKPERWPVVSLLGGTESALANEQQIVTVTETAERNRFGLEVAESVWSGETGNAVTTVSVHTSYDHFVDTCRKLSSAPLQLTAGLKSTMDENKLTVKKQAYPQESPVLCAHRSNPHPSFTDAFRGRYETSNKNQTYLEKDTVLDSETVVIVGSEKSGVSLKLPLCHTLEKTTAHWFSSPNSGTQPDSLGLEWFPELSPNYQRLGLFSRRQPQWDKRIPESQVLILPCEGQQVPLAEMCLMDVKLQDLPAWLATRDLSLQGVLGVPYRAWNRYCNRYINVKKGGVAGISMLLLSYCVLSYAWNYEHIKCSRWRKYH